MITLGSSQAFHTVGEYLRAEYSEAHLCQQLGLKSLVDFYEQTWTQPTDPVVSLLFVGAIVRPEQLVERLPASVFFAMRELGIFGGVFQGNLLFCAGLPVRGAAHRFGPVSVRRDGFTP